MSINLDTIRGGVLGLAYGDAYGYHFEFLDHDRIRSMEKGPKALYKISDDTQMSIYVTRGTRDTTRIVGEALVNIEKDETLQAIFAKSIADQFVRWHHDEDNNWDPGRTCIQSIAKYEKSTRDTGLEGSNPENRGNGANIRAGWLGLLPYADEDLAVMSILQAKVTHGHPDALLSSALTTLLVNHLAKKRIKPCTEGALVRHSIQLLDTRVFYDDEQNRLDPTNLRKLLTEALIVLPEYVYSSPEDDICSFFGRGATADEAFVLAVAATDGQAEAEAPTEGIRRLAESGGDSDSIAAIGGAMIGAYWGWEALKESTGPLTFEKRYQEELEECIKVLAFGGFA